MRALRYSRGFSLIELSIASVLLLLLLGSVYLLLVAGSRHLRLGSAYREAQSQALLALQRMEAELANSTPATFAQAGPPDHVIFLSADHLYPNQNHHWTYNGYQELEWRKWVAYYHLPLERRLVRSEQAWSGGPTAPPPWPGAPALSDLKAVVGPHSATLGRDIETFACRLRTDAVVIEIVASQTTGTGKSTKMRLTTSVRMHNSGS